MERSRSLVDVWVSVALSSKLRINCNLESMEKSGKLKVTWKKVWQIANAMGNWGIRCRLECVHSVKWLNCDQCPVSVNLPSASEYISVPGLVP